MVETGLIYRRMPDGELIAFAVRPSSFVVRRSSFVLRPSNQE